jgi:4-hydroxybenzoate polyprenyltransferase
MSVLREYLQLARLHSAVLTGLAPVLGALAASFGLVDLSVLIILFIIGMCTHIFGFVFNEYMDIEIDSKSELLKNKPLIIGTISKKSALRFAFIGVFIGYLLLYCLSLLITTITITVLILYTLSWLSIGFYDLLSKYAPGADVLLALWTGTLCLFGGFAVSDSPNLLLMIIAALAFLQLYIQNILAGLKDIYQDKLGSGTTLPLRMGVTIKGDRLMVPAAFQLHIYSSKLVHLSIAIFPFVFLWLYFNLFQVFFILLLLVINFILVFKIFNSRVFNRENLLRTIGLHEILSYSIVPVMFCCIIGIDSMIFLILFPIIWLALFMIIIYGQLVPEI